MQSFGGSRSPCHTYLAGRLQIKQGADLLN
jgi:hypothetical protein